MLSSGDASRELLSRLSTNRRKCIGTAKLILLQGRPVNSTRSKSVPKAAQAVYDAVVALTDAFCRDHLNDEYRDLAQAMTAALCRKRPNW